MPLIIDLGLKEQANKLGLGSFDPKLYRLVKPGNAKTENYSILTRVLLKAGPRPTGGDSPAAPSYANLFVGFIENKFLSSYHGPKPDLYKRYIDDCVCATSSSKEELNLFINAVNSFHPALKYTWEISENSLAFLDIKLSINNNGLSTSVYYKPTASHNFLLHSSSHPQHVKMPSHSLNFSG